MASVGLVALLITGLLNGLLFSATSFRDSLLPRQWIWIGLPAVLWLLYVVGMLYTSDWEEGKLFLFRSNALILLPLVVLLHRSWLCKHWVLYLQVLIGATIVAGACTLFLYYLPEPTVIRWIEQSNGLLSPYTNSANRLYFGLYSPFIDRLQFGNLLGLSILSALWLVGNPQVRQPKWLLWLAVGCLLFVHAFLGARAAQIGLVVSLVIPLSLLAQRFLSKFIAIKSHYAQGLAVLGVLLLVIGLSWATYRYFPAVFVRYQQLFYELRVYEDKSMPEAVYQDFTSIRRLVSWQNLWEIARQHWWWGVGTGDYYIALKDIYSRDRFDLPTNSHSQYLQVWVSVGFIGLFLFLASLLVWLRNLYRYADRWLFAFGLAVLVFFAIEFVFDAILMRQVDNMSFALFLSAIAAYALSERKEVVN